MPLRSNFSLEKFGFSTFPAKRTFLQLFSFNILIILPNCPMETLCECLSFVKVLLLVKSIIKYLSFLFFTFLEFPLENLFFQILNQSLFR